MTIKKLWLELNIIVVLYINWFSIFHLYYRKILRFIFALFNKKQSKHKGMFVKQIKKSQTQLILP